MKLCLGLGIEVEGHERRSCRKCRAVYAKIHRRTDHGRKMMLSYNDRVKKTQMARAKTEVFKRVRNGKMPKASSLICSRCGAQAQVYDHRDYSKPLEVTAVCRPCNHALGPGLNRC